jgi:uncharacterized membrane protein YhaH (DUF805 family)
MLRFDGRIGRRQYVGYFVLSCVIATVASSGSHLAVQIATRSEATALHQTIIVGAAALFQFWAGLSLMTRRLHDMGHSGLHTLWILALGALSAGCFLHGDAGVALFGMWVAAGNILVALWLLFSRGEAEDNEYGPSRHPQPPPAREPSRIVWPSSSTT